MVAQTCHNVQHWHTMARDRNDEPKGYRYVRRDKWRQNRLKELIVSNIETMESKNPYRGDGELVARPLNL